MCLIFLIPHITYNTPDHVYNIYDPIPDQVYDILRFMYTKCQILGPFTPFLIPCKPILVSICGRDKQIFFQDRKQIGIYSFRNMNMNKFLLRKTYLNIFEYIQIFKYIQIYLNISIKT